jgi:hypothetical protein
MEGGSEVPVPMSWRPDEDGESGVEEEVVRWK